MEEGETASSQLNRNAQQTRQGRSAEPGIPPTIEPPSNTEFQPTRGNTDASGNVTDNSQLSRLFYQIQVLQQELQLLRGQIEDQDYEIKQLQQNQQRQYRDIDKRLADLTAGGAAVGASASRTDARNPTGDGAGSRNAAVGSVDASLLTERQVYQRAFDAMKSRQFEQSMTGFEDLIRNYPNGEYTPNAYYWIGELHLVANTDPEQARQAFMQVVNLYPDHPKTADALYKLGVVYSTLGDNDSAMTYLNRVQVEHPDSSAAGLAAKYSDALQ